MNKIITLILLGTISSFAFATERDIVGKIKAVTYGEFDSRTVGDSCIVQLVLPDGTLNGIVTDIEDCMNNVRDFKKGRGVTIAQELVETIKSKKTLSVLNAIYQNTIFYKVPTGTLENGLED